MSNGKLAEAVRAGFLGGTFDPPHLAHLALARAALASGRIARVEWVPAASPPHKTRRNISPPAVRRRMLEILLDGEPGMAVNPVELTHAGTGPGYTVDTIRRLRQARPETAWRLIIGSDMALSFGTWREAKALLVLAPPLWAERPDFPWPDDPAVLAAVPGLAMLDDAERGIIAAGRIGMAPKPVSSTWLRERLAAGAPPADLRPWLPDRLRQYIDARRLY